VKALPISFGTTHGTFYNDFMSFSVPQKRPFDAFLRKSILLPMAVIIAGALWVTAAAMIENIRFAQATDQVLLIVGRARELASLNKNFAATPGEDLLTELARISGISGVTEGHPSTLMNAWDGTMTAKATAPLTMRLETDMPVRDCRRMAIFFIKNGEGLGLNMMETSQDASGLWRQFYNRKGMSSSDSTSIEVACGDSARVVLAMIFTLKEP
jgi:hypothetical protein